MNQLYELPLRVMGTGEVNGRGADVACYASAADYQSALKAGVAALAALGWRFENVTGPVRDIPAGSWDSYVASVWPEHAAHLPDQGQINARIAAGDVFFGPFLTFPL